MVRDAKGFLTGVAESLGKNMTRKSDFHLRSKSFGIPGYGPYDMFHMTVHQGRLI